MKSNELRLKSKETLYALCALHNAHALLDEELICNYTENICEYL